MADDRIFSAICGVMEDIGAVGKNDINKTQGFKYRGIDAVMNALSPAMVKHKVFCVPELLDQTREERRTAKGNSLIYSICRMRYRFYTTDGSHIEAVTVGEGMDSGDKATNKAMAIAFKYACFQTFCIPTEELMDDPDKESPEASEKKKEARKIKQEPVPNKSNENNSENKEKKEVETVATSQKSEMIQNVRKELKRTGLEEKVIIASFKLKKLEDMDEEQFKTCMKKFKVTPSNSTEKEGKANE